MLMAILVTISEEPLAQALPMTGQRRCGRTKYRCVDRLRAKYTSGMPPPMSSPMLVARAAPTSPQPNTPTNRKSSTMFITPAATMT